MKSRSVLSVLSAGSIGPLSPWMQLRRVAWGERASFSGGGPWPRGLLRETDREGGVVSRFPGVGTGEQKAEPDLAFLTEDRRGCSHSEPPFFPSSSPGSPSWRLAAPLLPGQCRNPAVWQLAGPRIWKPTSTFSGPNSRRVCRHHRMRWKWPRPSRI